MTTLLLLLRVVQRTFISLAGLSTVLILFTAMQFNLSGASLMAAFAIAFYVACRSVGWALVGFTESERP